MAVVRPRPYRRILTSILHQRFVHASAWSLLVCYIIAIIIGQKTSLFWLWFPIGVCGVRTVLLFISSLSIFVLRVGQMHIGSRTTTPQISTLKYLVPLPIIQTLGWYVFSAWWFNEIYAWSSPTEDFAWVKPGRPYERATLNEIPIYLHTYHIALAIVQSVVHLYYDYDRIPIPVAKPVSEGKDRETHPLDSVMRRLKDRRVDILPIAKRTIIFTAAFPVVYTLFLRRAAWSFTLYFAKLFWNFARSAAEPRGIIPDIGFYGLFRSVLSGTLLVLCWETANIIFSTYIGQEPLKRHQPLTTEAKDPNGSLLNGLKAKKEVVQAFAFWELSFISQRFPDRRKAIFSDIDREGGAAWSQILVASTELIKGISTRIIESKKSSSKPSPPEADKNEPELHTLPRLTEPARNEKIFADYPKATTRRERFTEAFSSTAKSYGQSADWTPAARAKARDVLDLASSAVLSPERKQRLLASSRELRLLTGPPSQTQPEKIHPLLARILRSPISQPLRQPYAQRLSAIVLGHPHSALCPIVDAIESVTRLLVASITEDTFGKVCADVPAVLRLFTETITTLEPFVDGGLDVHWTDITFPPSSQPQAQAAARRVPDVDLVLDVLKSSLADLVSAFSRYARDFGLGEKELRLAREAAGVEDKEKEAS